MRLIVKDYILQLKEKDELDVLISQIYEEKGYIPDNKAKTGNRQYGVDIQLHNKNEVLLFVIKQGNITRNTWDGDINSVRQSLDEIKDVFIPNLSLEEKKKSIRIIVATNGQKDESIRLNWNGYINSNKNWYGLNTNIEFLGIDDIVKDIIVKFFNEYLFEDSLKSAMRKALYFIDDGDYKTHYYEKIIDDMVQKLNDVKNNKKNFKKSCSTLYLSSQMICQYASDVGNNRVSIRVSEYIIIKYWKYLFENNLFENKFYIEWLIKFCKKYEEWNDSYVLEIDRIINKEMRLPTYNVIEDRLMIYEILGYMASYAYYLLEFNHEKSKSILNKIIYILNEYEHFNYPCMIYKKQKSYSPFFFTKNCFATIIDLDLCTFYFFL